MRDVLDATRKVKRTPDAATKLVSQALPVTLTLSKVCSFFAGWPKTWLQT